MAFVRVNPAGWALNDPLTSAQQNQLDINVSKAVDGTLGGTYVGPMVWSGAHEFTGGVKLASLLTKSGTTGRVLERFATIGDVDGDVSVAADVWKSTAHLTANRVYRVLSTIAPVPSEGDMLRICRYGTSASGETISVQREGGAVIGSFAGVTTFMFMDLIFIGGVWTGAACGPNVVLS